MKHKLISVALIAVLLCTVLGNGVACGPTTKYNLTITSTAGGNVTTPTEGTHTYDEGTVVNLVATADAGGHFVNWTGNTGTIANVTAANTTITMSGNYAITANFGLDAFKIITGVPDTNQPPTQTLASTNPTTNYCAPIAMANILEYWDDVANHDNAQNVTAGLIPETVAEYLGYFMDTNNMGSIARANGGQQGTKDIDIDPGTLEFVCWDAGNPFLTPPPVLPTGKLGYNWTNLMNCTPNPPDVTWLLYEGEIGMGRPLLVTFDFWNPLMTGVNYTDPETGETIDVFVWGNNPGKSQFPNPEEYWTTGDIGHAVTGVGYIKNWDPDGSGPILQANWAIVHDTWATTPENIAIPWNNWNCLHAFDPG